MTSPHRPIGVMDSGLGGLSVWKELFSLMPDEPYLYLGDSEFCPYGSRSSGEIRDRVAKTVGFLMDHGCKAIVVACNAITAASIDFLRQTYALPFIGMEPAIKPASLNTRTGAVGVLATERTLKGELFSSTRSRYARDICVVEKVGTGLVEKVEALDFDSKETLALLETCIHPMLAHNIDHLVLGCTHYPFLQNAIQTLVGDRVTLVNPAPAVALRTENVLRETNLRSHISGETETPVFYTTGDTEKMNRMLSFMRVTHAGARSVTL
ncbi:glutamate racemase [Desulfosarcina sp. OttesenSCG-928-A07]|nr:glutamate racemase [Desulfosarcina sp. OttesenSCG-928-A07]